MNQEGRSEMEKLNEGRIKAPGGEVWYRIAGASSPGVPLLVLHGGPGAPHDYLEGIEALSGERPVVLYDQLGCGNSDRPDDKSLWTTGRFIEELQCVRDALNLEELHLLGQSWGGMLAVDYLLERRPAGVRGLVISGPCLDSKRFVADARRWIADMPLETQRAIREAEENGDFASQAYQDAIMAFYHMHVCRLDPWPDCMERTIAKMGQAVYERMWGPSELTLTGTLKDYNRCGQLKDIETPTLLTCGRYDEARPETVALYESLIPHSTSLIFEDASHEHHLEKADAYNAALSKFLKRVETA